MAMRVALLFIDGVGIGRRDPDVNPLARVDHLLSRFQDEQEVRLPGGGHFRALDPTFGVPGRPQSASNQTAILTGRPAPHLIGRHVLGFPDAALRELLARDSLVLQLARHGRSATFANSYPSAYLRAMGLRAAGGHREPADAGDLRLTPSRLRHLKASASTLAFAAAGVPLRTLAHARADQGLTHDIHGRRARAAGLDVPERTPEEAAEVLLTLAGEADFTFFEHYLADEAGHAQDPVAALDALESFDRLLRAVVARRPPDLTVLVCSDHGNVEDLSQRRHTLHAVPMLGFGPGAEGVAALETLADVATFILSRLEVRSR